MSRLRLGVPSSICRRGARTGPSLPKASAAVSSTGGLLGAFLPRIPAGGECGAAPPLARRRRLAWNRHMQRRLIPCFVALCALAPVSACAPARLAEAARVLADIDAGAGPSALKAETPAPRRSPVRYQVQGRQHAGDLYEPGEAARAAMVLAPGVSPAGKDDPRLVAFAETLARARFRVLVPDLADLRELRISAGDGLALADATAHLEALTGGRGPLGITAISYAVGPAVAALFEAGVAERVDFLLAVGGYYDMEALITFFTTGHYREAPHAPWQQRRPNPYGKWVFVRSNAERLADAADRAGLRAMARRKLDDLGADVSDLAAGLGAEGRAVYAVLANRDPARVPALLAALPAAVRADMAALDPKGRDLKSLDVRFVLVHGRNDPIIPETESMALAAAAARAELFLVDSLDHVDPKPTGLVDRLVLLAAVYAVLALRDDDER